MNYYRNYHIYNNDLEKFVYQNDIFDDNDNVYKVFRDEDEDEDEDQYAEFLIPKESITEFWNLDANAEFIKLFKTSVYSWACTLGKSIQKYDKN